MLPRNNPTHNKSITSNKQVKVKWLFKNIKTELWKLYFFCLIILLELFAISTKLNEWTSFEPLIIFIAYSAITLISLYYVLCSNLLFSLIISIVHRFHGFNSIISWILHHLILVAILYAYCFRKVSTASIFIIATLLILAIVHIIIKYLQLKERNLNNPYFILWIGLISTFVGFTLSGYAQEIFKEKEDKDKLVDSLNIAIYSEKQIRDKLSDKQTEIKSALLMKQKILYSDFFIKALPENKTLEQILTKRDSYNIFSPMTQNDYGMNYKDPRDNRLKALEVLDALDTHDIKIVSYSSINPDNKKKYKENSQEYERNYKSIAMLMLLKYDYSLIQEKVLIDLLEIEKQYQKGSISANEYRNLYEEEQEDFKQYLDNIKKIPYENYVDNTLDGSEFHDSGILFTTHKVPLTIQEKIIKRYELTKSGYQIKWKVFKEKIKSKF
ncbi:hypothetical protein [Priestia megaterium]|uniref:hypothetical protein n=2 Tax=Priestia megaterium TaxID=1404 RepID=UPI0039F6F406